MPPCQEVWTHHEMRVGKRTSIWLGDIADEVELDEYLANRFASDFGFEIYAPDEPECSAPEEAPGWSGRGRLRAGQGARRLDSSAALRSGVPPATPLNPKTLGLTSTREVNTVFDWFRRKRPPLVARSNSPGLGHQLRAAFSNSERTWEESADLSTCLADTLIGLGHAPSVKGHSLELEGFTLQPQIVSFQPIHPSGVQTATTIEVAHPTLGRGILEYQHSTGDNLAESLSKGFKGWADLDLPVFLDALHPQPAVCTFLEMSLPPTAQRPSTLHRRVVLGPPLHIGQEAATGVDHDPHPFCPCCFYTNSHEAFKGLLESDGFYGIRLFALRRADGRVQADCRVNGEDWPAGIEPLVRYATSWPQRGFEVRKQYVCMQTVSANVGGREA